MGGKYGRKLIIDAEEQADDKMAVKIKETIFGTKCAKESHSEDTAPVVFRVQDQKKRAFESLIKYGVDSRSIGVWDLLRLALKLRDPKREPTDFGDGIEIQILIKPKSKGA